LLIFALGGREILVLFRDSRAQQICLRGLEFRQFLRLVLRFLCPSPHKPGGLQVEIGKITPGVDAFRVQTDGGFELVAHAEREVSRG
jgi:hypothetical protein